MADSVQGWRVVEASFVMSAPSVSECPKAQLPEVAFAGRSNVGKSSLLNALVGRTGLARTSRTPGRTQLLNLFDIRLHSSGVSRTLRCVDLPGYGFVASGAKMRGRFAPMIEDYIAQRETLQAVILLIDARRGLGDLDTQLLEYCTDEEVPAMLVVTKIDKIGASQRGVVRKDIAASVGVPPRDVLMTSASKGLGLNGPHGLAADLAALVAGAEEAAGAEAEPDAASESEAEPDAEPDPDR
jgi:GTP-binding protein